ncbi:MAG: VacJ family lipoprotein [Phycisphaeraceae bacterium]|nr:VacJ family lipoprotein [Phycisphaeraceae bacterium]
MIHKLWIAVVISTLACTVLFSQDIDEEDLDFLEEELSEPAVTISDPLESINRFMYNFNDAAYAHMIRPVSRGYKAVTPKPARLGLRNFFSNLGAPIRFANCLLQGKGDAAWIEMQRFLVNTTAGVLGFGDPALDRHGLSAVEEDLGQTLATYGVGDGIYLVLPFLGPTTLRDSVGRIGDTFLSPVIYVEPTEAYLGISALRLTNTYSIRGNEYEALKADAIEPYSAMKSAYIQYRKKKIEK